MPKQLKDQSASCDLLPWFCLFNCTLMFPNPTTGNGFPLCYTSCWSACEVVQVCSRGLRINGSILKKMQRFWVSFFPSRGNCLPLCVFYTTDHFKEICPAGHGYTYSLSDVQISVRRLGEDGVQSTGLSWEEQSRLYPQIPSSHPSLPFGPRHPSYPQTPQIHQYPDYSETQVPQDPLAPQQPLYPFYPDREPLEQPQGENEKWHNGKSLPGNVYS